MGKATVTAADRMKTTDVILARQQWLAIKRQYPHAVIFVVVGDFYETFSEDAEVCDRERLLTAKRVTSRSSSGDGYWMAGLPRVGGHHLAAELLTRGYAVALCDPVDDAMRVGAQPTPSQHSLWDDEVTA